MESDCPGSTSAAGDSRCTRGACDGLDAAVPRHDGRDVAVCLRRTAATSDDCCAPDAGRTVTFQQHFVATATAAAGARVFLCQLNNNTTTV